MAVKRALFGLLACACAVAAGCGRSADSQPTPTPSSYITKIQNNPHMTQEQKDAAIQMIRSRQQNGQTGGQEREKQRGHH